MGASDTQAESLDSNPDLTREKRKWLDDAGRLLGFLWSHPEFINLYSAFNVIARVGDRDGLAEFARTVGKTKKSTFGDHFFLDADFGVHKITAGVDREQVCKRVVTIKEIPAETIPAKPAEPEQVLPARTVEEVTWECEPIFAARDDEGVQS